MTCPHCGDAAPAGARFCRACGERFAPPRDATSGVAEPASQSSQAVRVAPSERTAVVPPVSQVPATAQPEGRQRIGCPACGAPNSSSRVLCGRCGADLETGEIAARPLLVRPVANPEPTEDTDETTVARRRTRAATVAVGSLLAATIVLAVLAALDRLPFAEGGGGDAPAARFEAAAYPEPRVDLDIDRLSTSSTLPAASDTQRYDASLMADGDLETAWNNDGRVNPGGVGEVVRARFDQPVWLSSIVIANGEQRDDDTYLGNARLRRAQVTLDGGVSFVVTLEDQQDLQRVSFEEPELTTTVRIDVIASYPGDTYEDLAISELVFRGYPANDRDVEIADQRAEAAG